MSISVLLAPPAAAKSRRTMYTDAIVQSARQKVATQDWAKTQVDSFEKASQFFIEMSDEELWNYIPPAAQFRALNVNFGADCPVHGAEIHRKAGHYPWIMSRDKPFKLECPIGHEIYPSNDFKPWWGEGKAPVTPENSSPHEKYVDNGAGWVDEKGTRYWFVPHYMFWQRWRRDVIAGVDSLAQAYLLTGKPIYGHKCAVMLARIAQEYPQMDYLKQAYHHGYPTKVRGKILDYIWETSTVSTLSSAYDAAYPATDLTADAPLGDFLKTKGITDLRATVEKNIVSEMIERLMDNTIRGNMGMPQRAMAALALVLDNDDPAKGHTTKELVEWILKTEPGKTTGETDDLFYNGFYRDGHGGESSPGYSAGWTTAFYQVAKDLQRLNVNLFERPKMKRMADLLLDMTMAGQFSPSIGDNGSTRGAGRLWFGAVFKKAWQQYRDPRFAQALKILNFKDQSLWEDSLEEEIDRAATGLSLDFTLPSRNLGGYGLAVLETGEGSAKRAVSMYYGAATGGHGQRDRLSTEAWFHGKPMLTEHGYPAHWLPKNSYWTGNTVSHYAVVVDRQWQKNLFAGQLNYLVAAPHARVMDASSEGSYEGAVDLYRHTTAMVDMSPSRSYLFDVWRVRGGSQHDWSFHGFPFADFSAPTVNWSPVQKTGTLAGENVKFADEKAPNRESGFQYLFNVQRGRPSGDFTSQWKSTADDTALKMTLLNPPAEVIAADCEPELQPGSPETMKYLLARNVAPAGGKALQSTFAAVIEPVKGEGNIRSAQSLQPLTPNPDFAGARVEYTDEKGTVKTDYVLSGLDAKTAVKLADGLEFSGQFGVASTDSLLLVNGTTLEQGGRRIEAAPVPARITAVDDTKNEITLDVPFAAASLTGKIVTISNSLHSTSYTIKSASNANGKTVIGFGDVLPIIGDGHIASLDAAKGEVTTDTVLTGHARVDGGRHKGRWLATTDKKVKLKIKEFDGKVFKLDGTIPAGAFASNRFFILDFNIGDDVQVPSVQHVKFGASGQYQVSSTVPFTLSVPANAGPNFLRVGTAWQPLEAAVNGRLQVRLDPMQFVNGEAVLVSGKPEWLDLNDVAAPVLSRVALDGKTVDEKTPMLQLKKMPQRLSFRAADKSNPLAIDTMQVNLDGAPVAFKTAATRDGKGATVEVVLPAMNDGSHLLSILAADRAVPANQVKREIAFQIADGGNLALKSNGTTVLVESSFPGYESLSSLTDGNTVLPGDRSPTEISWASAETSDPHWVEMRWPKSQTIGRVALHWARFNQVDMTSREFAVQAWDGKDWKTVANSKSDKAAAVSVMKFKPVKTDRLRIHQESGKGSSTRPNLLWLAEIKVFAK